MGLFSRRRYAEGTVPDHVEELDGPVLGPPPSAYQEQPSYPPPGDVPDEAAHETGEAGDAGESEEFYDDEDSEDRPEPGERDQPRFLPPPPRRMPTTTRRGFGLGAVAFGLLVFLARAIVGALPDGGSGDGSARWNSVRDVYAGVASEPERRLTAQGVEFQLLENRPLDPAVCGGLDQCLAAAAADWEVTGTTLQGRSWFLVFEHEDAADAAAGSAHLGLALAPGVPSTWALRAGSPGRFLVVAGVGPADGGAADVSADPVAVEAADALRIFSTEPAVIELANR